MAEKLSALFIDKLGKKMSRVAKKPVSFSADIEVKLTGNKLTVKGSKGSLSQIFNSAVNVEIEDGNINFSAVNSVKSSIAIAGSARANTANMVHGVSQGFEKKLELHGVGYRAQVKGDLVDLSLGFSHPAKYKIPADVSIEMPSQTEILIKGVDKQRVGQVAAEIRAYRPPEPYKGKGVRYSDERIILKDAKKK